MYWQNGIWHVYYRSSHTPVIALVFVPPTFVRVPWRGLKGEAPAFHNRDQFLEYFQDTWIEGNYPLQLAAGGLPFRRRRKYRRHEKRLLTINEKYEAGDYTLSELVKAFSNWVSF